MNIEKLLDELGQDLQNAPVEMDKPAMRKSMTRKRTLHRIGVAGRTVGIALTSLFLVLFLVSIWLMESAPNRIRH